MAQDKFNPTGHLEIWKVYEDGEKELHWSDHNVITSGMGVGLAHLYSARGSNKITDYQIINWQVGTGGDLDDYGVSTFKLNSPLGGSAPYGIKSFMTIDDLTPIENGSTGPTRSFPRIPFTNIDKVSKTAVRFTLVLDNNSGNSDTELDEVGLFMRNPKNFNPAKPILVAYRPFLPIKKTRFFTLIFLWTLQF
jgi:hypothetical protein